ncbi:hypothetical protein Salat_2434500 [Sesamum alatum]|uniref:Uncharacterized protein n=1 Tax=Sesamum alatum TaxID=300844 RepID=A0AAE2CFJ6_9LAMI|nr:hypothetical protein Salat_2434500 [Sesamum alatum]
MESNPHPEIVATVEGILNSKRELADPMAMKMAPGIVHGPIDTLIDVLLSSPDPTPLPMQPTSTIARMHTLSLETHPQPTSDSLSAHIVVANDVPTIHVQTYTPAPSLAAPIDTLIDVLLSSPDPFNFGPILNKLKPNLAISPNEAPL